MRAAHEVGHYLAARARGLRVVSIDIINNGNQGGQADVPGLHRAPLLDQVCVLRAGIVAADMIGPKWDHGGSGDFRRINELLDGARLLGDEQRAIIARADRFVEKTIRENRDEFQQLVAELVAKRQLVFEQPKPTPAVRAATPAPKPTAPLVQTRREPLPLMRRSFDVKSYDAATRTFECIFTSGATVRRVDRHGDYYDEELVVTPEAVDLGRLRNGAPLLSNHDSSNLDAVIGSVVSARIEGGLGLATCKLSGRKGMEGVAIDVADGILHQVSCGYKIEEAERIQRGDVPLLRATRWCPYELSLVCIGADPSASVRDAPTHEAMVRS